MWVWWMMTALGLLIPILMISFGNMMRKHCPEKIDINFGYRTKRSMQNMDTWKFAHSYCGKLWWKIGWVLLIVTVFLQILMLRVPMESVTLYSLILMFAQTAVMLLTILPTERALKKHFDDHGQRRRCDSPEQ